MDFRGLFLPPGARAGPSRAQAPSLGDREGVPPLPRLTACAARVIPLPRDQPSMRHSPAQLAARQKPMAHTPSASSGKGMGHGLEIREEPQSRHHAHRHLSDHHRRYYCPAGSGDTALVAVMVEQHRRSTSPLRDRSEEHTSELQSLMRISYAVFCLNKKQLKHITNNQNDNIIK